MVQEAARFAAAVHEGKVRKGTRIPYISHPLEAAVIVAGITGDEEVISGALLHDVIEDAGVTYDELRDRFGRRVADLVLAESEDKTKTWEERKAATIEHMKTAAREVKIICLGDKLGNLRSTAADRLLKGESVWQKFRVKDKAMHEWYYRGVLENLGEFRAENAYREYVRLVEQIFGDHTRDLTEFFRKRKGFVRDSAQGL